MSAIGTRISIGSFALLASACALVLAGCGVGNDMGEPVSGMTASVAGIVHGGPNPVSGATVTMYVTTSAAYGTGGTSIGTATTDASGNFSFSSLGTCTAGQQAYITASGGNPGSGTNPQYLLMAALGDCSGYTGTAHIWIDEVTTVAAAYALDNFMSINGTTVHVSAPTNNNAETPSCTGTGSSMACTAAGLKHAFQNAQNLADAVELDPAHPTGQAYQVTPSNSDGSVPTALINSLANAIEACVNSTGGTAGDSSACGKLFTDTTPPVTSPTAPTNTLQAAIDVAKYPALTAANVTSLYNLASPISAYQPSLATAPSDWSLAITYTGETVGATTSSFGSPYNIGLDAADDVYVDFYNSATTSGTLGAMSSNGAGLYYNTTGFGTTYTYGRAIAPDTAGHLWIANASTTAGAGVLLEFSAADGSLTNTITGTGAVYGAAVDRNNNAYFTVALANANDLFTVPAGTTTATAISADGSPVQQATVPRAMGVDAGGNLWDVQYSTTATNSYFVGNTGSIGTPAFANAGILTTQSSSVGYVEGVVFDANGNAWVNNDATLYQMPAPPSAAPASSVSVASGSVTAYETGNAAVDGSDNIFLPDYNKAKSYLWMYNQTSGSVVYMNPCLAPAGATSCNSGTTAGTYPALYNARSVQIDSTGSVWVASGTNDSVVQVLGVGAPAWPQLSYGKFGVMPQ